MNVNVIPTSPDLILHYAAIGGHQHIMEYLINDCKCNPLCPNRNNETPLHCVAEIGQLKSVKYLTSEHQSDASMSRNDENDTPIHCASLGGAIEVLRYFISDCKYDPNITGYRGRTLLHYAAKAGHINIMEYFINENKCDPLCRDI